MPSDAETLSAVRSEKSQYSGYCEKFIMTTMKGVWAEYNEAQTAG